MDDYFFIEFNKLLYICLPGRWKEHIKLKKLAIEASTYIIMLEEQGGDIRSQCYCFSSTGCYARRFCWPPFCNFQSLNSNIITFGGFTSREAGRENDGAWIKGPRCCFCVPQRSTKCISWGGMPKPSTSIKIIYSVPMKGALLTFTIHCNSGTQGLIGFVHRWDLFTEMPYRWKDEWSPFF